LFGFAGRVVSGGGAGCDAAVDVGGVQPGDGSKALVELAGRVGVGAGGGGVAVVVWACGGAGCGAGADVGGIQPAGGSNALFGLAGAGFDGATVVVCTGGGAG
jgi:hypothetical protein